MLLYSARRPVTVRNKDGHVQKAQKLYPCKDLALNLNRVADLWLPDKRKEKIQPDSLSRSVRMRNISRL